MAAIGWLLTIGWCVGLIFGKVRFEKSVTTASGTKAPDGPYNRGDLIFSDDFDALDLRTWQHEITASGGGNWEFSWYTNNRSNSYVADGSLWIRPTLTSDQFGQEFLSSGTLSLYNGAPADRCTNAAFWGCERTGTPANVLNPIQSARLRTVHSFSFRYGRVRIRAKMPAGDWLWPAIWMMPRDNAYGNWPASGEIDIAESRGNRRLVKDGYNIGVQQVGSTLHFGPYSTLRSSSHAHFSRNNESCSYDADYHLYEFVWTPEYMRFVVDEEELGTIAPDNGFWKLGQFEESAPGVDDPWRYGTKMAPFDQEFYFIVNLAVGGIDYFPDDASNANEKPWLNTSPAASTDFWKARSSWLPTWNLNDDVTANLAIDYVRVWAL